MSVQRSRVCAWLVLSVLFCCTHAAHAAPPKQAPTDLPAPRPRDGAFRRGVTLGPLVTPDSPEEFKRTQAQRLSRAVALGATDVRLLVRWTQTQLDAVELAPLDSIDDELLGWLIAAARSRKLRVWLVPTVAVESPDGERPAGSVAPTSWDRWWWSYRRFVLHYAQVAAARKVPLLAVGNGLTSTEADAERWRALIRDVRKRYTGELTYVASSDSFAKVGFWHDLDLVGVALAPGMASSDAALAPLPARIEQTEPAREFLVCEADPSLHEPDAGDLLRARQAVYERFVDEPKLGGVYVNDVEPTHEPRAKKAKRAVLPPEAEVIRQWYQRSRR